MSSVLRWTPPIVVKRSWVYAPLIVAAFASLAMLVFVAQRTGSILPLVGLTGMCLGVLVTLRPAIGIVSIVLSAAFVRLVIGTGTGSVLVVSLLCALLLVVGWIIHRRIEGKPLILLPNSITIPAFVLAASTLISFLWSRLVIDPRIDIPETFIRVQIGQLMLFLVPLGLLFVGADVLRSGAIRNALVVIYIVVGIIALPVRAFEFDTLIETNTTGLFGLWFVSLCWANALANSNLRDWMRLGLAALAFGWLWMAYFREGSWVSGWLPGVVAMLLITIIARRRLGIVVATVVAVGAAFYYSILYDVLVTTQKSEGSIGGEFGRLELIKRNLEVIDDHLLLGTGPAGYALYYMTFIPDKAMSTHNNYVDVLAQFGVPGLLAFVALLVSLAVLAIRLVPKVQNPTDRALTIAIAGATPALVGSLWLGDWLVPFVYNQTIAGFDHAVYSWLMLASLCGLEVEQRIRGISNARSERDHRVVQHLQPSRTVSERAPSRRPGYQH